MLTNFCEISLQENFQMLHFPSVWFQQSKISIECSPNKYPYFLIISTIGAFSHLSRHAAEKKPFSKTSQTQKHLMGGKGKGKRRKTFFTWWTFCCLLKVSVKNWRPALENCILHYFHKKKKVWETKCKICYFCLTEAAPRTFQLQVFSVSHLTHRQGKKWRQMSRKSNDVTEWVNEIYSNINT